MSDFIAVKNIEAVVFEKVRIPTITMWNRLEGRPRTANFERALRAEVRDPLWMLTRQWQMGEFIGDDAGSPVMAKAHLQHSPLLKYRPGTEGVESFPQDVPLEAIVEKQPIPFQQQAHKLQMDIRVQMGRYWLKLIKPLGDFRADFIEKYPVRKPDQDELSDVKSTAHLEDMQFLSALGGRAMDGKLLYDHLTAAAGNQAYDDMDVIPEGVKPQLDDLGARFVRWFDRQYYQPQQAEQQAWQPERLEYQFSCGSSDGQTEKVLVAEEYYHGHLDWYNLDVDQQQLLEEPASPSAAEVETYTFPFIPVPLDFEGMPHTRWWTFEESKTSFGNVRPDTTDLNKLMLIEFGLLYANDWFLLPFTLPTGRVASLRGLSVTNVFGERTWIEAAGKGDDEDWQRWSMFNSSIREDENVAADLDLLVLPSVPKIQEGKPTEEVFLLRDEMANMVWGVETRIPLANGRALKGREAAREIHERYTRLLGSDIPLPDPLENEAKFGYQLMNTVPENWIPFIPVHKPGDKREIQLQRAAMPRMIEGNTDLPEKVEPRTSLLRHGLDGATGVPYFLHEEEVSRVGTHVTKSYQRTRWMNGDVFTWLGVRKRSGRGEGSSGLAFDQLLPK